MSGDWIKMRPALLTSPKVNGIARELERNQKVSRVLATGFNGPMSEIVTRNVMRSVTLGALLVVWGAANEHTKDGVFRDADLSDIDDMVGIPGFGDAMEAVGWLHYDDENCVVTLPNFDEYNTTGQQRSGSAKTAAERQKEYRDRKKAQSSDVTPVTTSDVTSDVTSNRREEKRREEKSKPKSKAVGSATASRLPPDWIPSDVDQHFCATERPDLDCKAVADRFRDHWISKPGADGRKIDWSATWRNWVRRENAIQPRASPRQSVHEQRADTIAILTGRAKNERSSNAERDITGEAVRVA